MLTTVLETWHGPSNRSCINPISKMNNDHKLLTLVLLAGTAGLASFGLANTELAARLPLDVIMGAAVSAGLLRFAFSDYSRRLKPLALPAALVRPARRSAAYGLPRHARVERLAA